MGTFKITLAYDGTDFVGWQRQAAGTSVQGLLEDALEDLDGGRVAVAGAGRTDAGVHARGQVASFSLTRSMETPALVGALNARLPGTVRVLSAEAAPESFHARFDATRKTYRYRIWNAEVLDPFERRYTWHVMAPLDRDAMAESARLIEGRHDFAAFQTGAAARATLREVFSSRVIAGLTSLRQGYGGPPELQRRRKPCATAEGGRGAALQPSTRSGSPEPVEGQGCDPLIVYEITGDGFLRHMVRTIAGTLLEVGRRRRPADWIREILASRDRSRAGPTAPPEGLVLLSVEYPVDCLRPIAKSFYSNE